MKRIFIAVKTEPDQVFQRMYSSLRSLLGSEKITWVSQENIHLTLAFLGEIDEDRIKAAAIVLSQKCTGFGEFVIRLSGVGLFRNIRDPRVLWIGIENPGKPGILAELISRGLKDTGFKTEERPFKPHITLGRIKFINNIETLESAIERYHDSFIQDIHVTEVKLYESILRPEGPVYHTVGKFNLK